jgi:hypothetical protein
MEDKKIAKEMGYHPLLFIQKKDINGLLNSANIYNPHDLLHIKNSLDALESDFFFYVEDHNEKKAKAIKTEDLEKINKVFLDFDLIRLFVGKGELKEAAKRFDIVLTTKRRGPAFIMELLRRKDSMLSSMMYAVGVIPKATPPGEM